MILSDSCFVVYSSTDGFDSWTFSTVRCWAERPYGLYRIKIYDQGEGCYAAAQNLWLGGPWFVSVYASQKAISFKT